MAETPKSIEINLELASDRMAELLQAWHARERTIDQMLQYIQESPEGSRSSVNCSQVINLLSLTWPDGNESNG